MADPAHANRIDTRFDALLEAAVDAIIVIDERGTVTEFSPAAEKLFGYSRGHVVGQCVDMLMPEPYRSQHANYLRRYLEGGDKHVIGMGREVEGMRSNGETFPVWVSVGEAKLDGCRTFVGILRDLSAVRAEERRRHFLEMQLAHLDRFSLLGEMAAGIAHEINQPLAAISNYSHAAKRLLASASLDHEALTEACAGISDQAHRASQVIDNIRSLTHKQEVRKEMLAINDVIAAVLGLIVADAHSAGIRVETELADDLPRISGNAIQLQQVLINLTHNAVDAMRDAFDRDQPIRIKTRRLDDNRVEVAISDRGTGVSPRLREAIFHPFVTTKRGGIGVGLSISRTIVHAHSGELDYVENPDGGSTFTVTLPAIEEASDG